MSDRPPRVDTNDWEFLQELERRRNQSDAITWTVPGLAVAAEAFLLTIVLRPETQPAGRFFASLAGVIVVFATLHLFSKSAFNFDLWDAHINAVRRDLHLRSVLTKDELFERRDELPDGERIRTRRYDQRWRVWYWLGYRLPASTTWAWALQALLILNVLLALYSLLEWWNVIDWGWFGSADDATHHGSDHGIRHER